MNYMKKGFGKGIAAAGLLSILMFATPAFAQSYYGNNGYTNGYANSYYPQQPAYGNQVYNQVYQPVNMYSYGYMNSYPTNVMQQPQHYYAAPQQNTYQQNSQSNFYYTYPPVNQVRYNPSSYQYSNPTTRSYPDYDPYYSHNSNYYTTYPQLNMGYTGDRDGLGTPLCNWQGYGRSDCSFDPHQWVYDPYTGTWY